jgi:ATP-dependent DNA helicase RecQ
MSNLTIYKSLKKNFDFDSFRKGQEEIILNLLEGRDTLAVMPTSGGKSLCYQLPALHLNGTALVISPLIALMKDQVDSLIRKKIPSAFINSSLSFDETNKILENTYRGNYKLLYIAPERLENKRFIEALKGFDISFLAIDEAHCISEWGHDFRPSYLQISEAVKILGDIPKIALTATATPEVQEDIINSLEMKDYKKFVRGFDRENLTYLTETTENKLSRIVDICEETKEGSTIIYCGSRKRVELFTAGLLDMGIQAISYHAGLPDKFRIYAQERFLKNESTIIVATSAFGMGIDKPDVRNVIHCDLTQTLEQYYQEAGRAGRDGKPSKCYLLYHPSDRKLQEFFINSTYPSVKDIETIYNYLFDLNYVSIGQKSYEPIYLSDTEIGNATNLSSISVHSIIKLLGRNKILKRGSTHGTASVHITTSQERVQEYYENIDTNKKKVLEAILRNLSSNVFYEPVEFNIRHFMQKYDINDDELKDAVRTFEFAQILSFRFPGFTKGISLLTERRKIKDIPIDFNAFRKRRTNAIKKLNIMQEYAETDICKRNFILNYFEDEEINGVCGKCTSCTGHINKKTMPNSKEKYLRHKILDAVEELSGGFGKTVVADFLKGTKSKSIKQHSFWKKNSFASCSDYSLREIRAGIDKCLSMGELFVSNGKYPIISLPLYKQSKFEEKIKKDEQVNTELQKDLMDMRAFIAKKNGIVERAIVSDKTLNELARYKPITIDELDSIDGIGPVFKSNFAVYFLEVIRKYRIMGKSISED